MATDGPKSNLPAGIGGALVGALIGAFAWAYLVSVTDYKIGFAALGVGALAGFLAGKLGGAHPVLPIAAGVIGLLGCVLGDVMIYAHLEGEFARSTGGTVSDVTAFKEMVTDPAGDGWQVYKSYFEYLDAVFYALAAVFGFRLAKQFGEQAAAAADPWPAPSSDENPSAPAPSPTGSTDPPVSLEKSPDSSPAEAGHEGHDHGPGGHSHTH